MHNKTLKVAITGASGFVGRNVGKFLSENGISIIAIIRKEKLHSIKFGTPLISNDLSEKYLQSKLRGCSVLLHFIGKGRQTADSDYRKVNIDLTKNALNLCKKTGIKKIIYISGLGVNKDVTSDYFISKLKAEREIIRSGLDYTIFRSSYIIGDDDHLTQVLLKQIKNGIITIAGSGNYHIQPIFIEDVVRVILQSINHKKYSKKIIDLVGPKIVTYKCFIKNFLQGKKIKIKNIKLEEAYYSALHYPKSMFGVDDLNILIGDYIGDHKKLKKISGIEFKTYKEALKTCRLS